MSSSFSKNSSRNKHFNNNSNQSSDIDISKEEFSRISDAFKNDEFKKLFFDYCQEIQDPANRKLYEDELTQLEAERGVDIKFVNPEPGFVVETSVDSIKKCYINVAKSSIIAKPTNKADVNAKTGTRGLVWSIPMSQAPPRDDYDEIDRIPCFVYDVVFHPDALYLAEKNSAFRKCLVDTACDGVEREFHVKLDRTNLKFPDIKFKGMVHSTVIRKLVDNYDSTADANEPHPLENMMPAKPDATSFKTTVIPINENANSETRPEFTTPKFVVKHRKDIDYAEMTFELDAKLNVTIPRELVVEVDLPLLASTADCQLDVTANSVYLLSEKPGAKYKLKIDLPYNVNEKDGTARFDAETRRLIITLPVVRCKKERLIRDLYRDDSGVESDVRDEIHSSSDSPVEDVNGNNKDDHSNASDLVHSKSVDTTATPLKSSPVMFLKNCIQYNFPEKIDCNVLDNVMSIVLHVRNVQPESIAIEKYSESLYLQFMSLGSGYYPVYYAFYLQLLSDKNDNGKLITIDSAEAEAWENNVVLNINLSSCSENLQSYLAGLDKSDLKEYRIKGILQSKHQPENEKISASVSSSSPLAVSVERSETSQSIEIDIKPREASLHLSATDDEVVNRKNTALSVAKKQRKKNKKRRSFSESSCDDIVTYQKKEQQLKEKHHTHPENIVTCHSVDDEDEPNSSPEREQNMETLNKNSLEVNNISSAMLVPLLSSQARKQRSYSESRNSVSAPSYKGILKHYSRYDRGRLISDSYSSIEDHSLSSNSCSVDGTISIGTMSFSNSFSDIPEERDPRQQDPNSSDDIDYLSESCKKTVRFNEVIKKQVFRLDSSILGQRKKNQKRKNKKQRALQRRLSEGDSADYEDNKPVSPKLNERYLKERCGDTDNHQNCNSKNDDSTTSFNRSEQKHLYHRLELECSSDIECKNSMMFEMDM